MAEMIKTVNLTKIYGGLKAVDNLNLSVKRGEILGFLGLNGAGKTTAIRMLLGLIKPTKGQCYLQGERIGAKSIEIWRDVGYIVETPFSYPELTVRENLAAVLALRGIKDKTRLDWILQKLRLQENANKKTKHLSLGNAQRLGIAKALIHRPKILLLDEPTNGLDPAGIVEVRQLLLELAKNSGVAVLVSSHQLDEIAKLTTNIAIIHRGKLIKKIDGEQLERQLIRTLILDGKDKEAMKAILTRAGYKVALAKLAERTVLKLAAEAAVRSPDEIARLLVNGGQSPTLLWVEKENLETYFLRTLKEAEGSVR